jgi:hypothetical protein
VRNQPVERRRTPSGETMLTSPRRARSTLLILATVACSSAPRSAAPSSTNWDRFVSGYLETYFQNNPLFAVYQGRHELDGRWPDWSQAGLRRWTARLHALRDSAAAFAIDPADSARAFERDYVLARSDNDLFWLERADWPHRNPEWYSNQIEPGVYLVREYAPLAARMRALTRFDQGLPGALAQIRGNLRSPMPKAYAEIAHGRFGGMAEFFQRDVPKVFAPVRDSALHREFDDANAGAIRALQETASWFAEQARQGTDAFAMGRTLFAQMLAQTEQVTVPLDRLEAIGRADLERNLAALRQACGQYAAGATLAQCTEREEAQKPAEGPVEAARHQLDTLRKFVIDHRVVSVPGPAQAEVRVAPPYQRFNAAYIDIPGPYEKKLPSIYYIAEPDPSWSPAERAAYVPGRANLLFTSVHEVWPGHFLQFLHAQRARSKFGQVFVGYAYAEGWAHYGEQMMWDVGLGSGNPETHIGQLLNALLRDVRFISAIGLHTQGMTLAQSERMFREQAFQDPGNSRQQAARGAYDPAYLNYTLGKLMILKLRDDWTATRGGQTAWREFHDRFLSYGGPPIPLVRRAMLGERAGPPLTGAVSVTGKR